MKYAELFCKTNYSFLEGASRPAELMERAAELEIKAIDGSVHAVADVIEALPLMRFETMGDLSHAVEDALRLPNAGTDRIGIYGVPRP